MPVTECLAGGGEHGSGSMLKGLLLNKMLGKPSSLGPPSLRSETFLGKRLQGRIGRRWLHPAPWGSLVIFQHLCGSFFRSFQERRA